jgi:hypothetical protein
VSNGHVHNDLGKGGRYLMAKVLGGHQRQQVA